MNCEDIAKLTPLYLSGELAEECGKEHAHAFADHLRTCASCAKEVESQAAFDSELRSSVLIEDTDPAVLDERIRQSIAALPESTRPRTGFRPAFAAAGIAAVLLLGFLGYRSWSTTPIPRACTDAARDHEREVVDRQSRTWLTEQAPIEALAARQGVPVSAVAALAPANYHVERGKICRLDGHLFLHLVYTDGAQEFSAFLRPRDPQSAASASPSTGTASDSIRIGRENVGFVETQRLTAVVVTNQSGEAAGRLARFVASVL